MKIPDLIERETSQLKQREQALKEAISKLHEELQETQSRLNYWNAIAAEAEGELVPLKNTPPTKKNERVRQAWIAIQQAFRKRPGIEHLSAKELHSVMLSFLPDLKDTTFRAYIHKFRKDGLIEKRSPGVWALTKQAQK